MWAIWSLAQALNSSFPVSTLKDCFRTFCNGKAGEWSSIAISLKYLGRLALGDVVISDNVCSRWQQDQNTVCVLSALGSPWLGGDPRSSQYPMWLLHFVGSSKQGKLKSQLKLAALEQEQPDFSLRHICKLYILGYMLF